MGKALEPIWIEEQNDHARIMDTDELTMIDMQSKKIKVTNADIGEEDCIRIKYSLVPDDENDRAYVKASCSFNNKTYTNQEGYLSYDEINNTFKQSLTELKPLSEYVPISNAQNMSTAKIIENLFDDNILLESYNIEGLGFIFIRDKKIMTIEKLDYNAENNEQVVIINQCCSDANITTLSNMLLKFQFKNKEWSAKINEVKETLDDGLLSSYKLTVSDVSIRDLKEKEILLYVSQDEYDLTLEDDLNDFVYDRKELLSNEEQEEEIYIDDEIF